MPRTPTRSSSRAPAPGDVGAFEDLLRRHQARVYRTLVGLTGSVEDAEDCCQSTFVKAFRKIGDFAGAARFSTWLTRIAINEGLERLRRRRPDGEPRRARPRRRGLPALARRSLGRRSGAALRPRGDAPARAAGARAATARLPRRRDAAGHRAALDGRGRRDPRAAGGDAEDAAPPGPAHDAGVPRAALRGASEGSRMLSCDELRSELSNLARRRRVAGGPPGPRAPPGGVPDLPRSSTTRPGRRSASSRMPGPGRCRRASRIA